MFFAQFYKLSTGYISGTIPPEFDESAKEPIEACGSDGVQVLDGRFSLPNLKKHAEQIAKKRGFIGYSLHKGDSFMRATTICEYIGVSKND